MNSVDAADWLAALAHSLPALSRAACRGRAELFTSDRPADVAQAAEVCAGCPELKSCRAWARAQPPRTLLGVIAGENFRYDFARKEVGKP